MYHFGVEKSNRSNARTRSLKEVRTQNSLTLVIMIHEMAFKGKKAFPL